MTEHNRDKWPQYKPNSSRRMAREADAAAENTSVNYQDKSTTAAAVATSFLSHISVRSLYVKAGGVCWDYSTTLS